MKFVSRRLIEFLRGAKPSQTHREDPLDSSGDDNLAVLEDKIGHRFQNRDILRQAITHKSFAHELEEDPSFHNESLEFLGDSVLGFLITDGIYHAFPSVNEGRLSKIKAYLVSSSSLSTIAQKIDLPQHLRLGKGEEKTGGRKKKALSANAFEAILAALYLDAGMTAVRAFLEPLFGPIIEDIKTGRAVVEDAKTTLQEYLQARNMPPASYVVSNETGPEHRKVFHVELSVGDKKFAVATGMTKKSAETQAAQLALVQLKSSNKNSRTRELENSALQE
jgi:ribonuclease-3